MKYTRENVKDYKGHDARKAETLLNSYPEATAVIVSDQAITKRVEGAKLAWLKGATKPGKGDVIYYRKSSGGNWGRSSSIFILTPVSEEHHD